MNPWLIFCLSIRINDLGRLLRTKLHFLPWANAPHQTPAQRSLLIASRLIDDEGLRFRLAIGENLRGRALGLAEEPLARQR